VPVVIDFSAMRELSAEAHKRSLDLPEKASLQRLEVDFARTARVVWTDRPGYLPFSAGPKCFARRAIASKACLDGEAS
jgi:hypothetical protein